MKKICSFILAIGLLHACKPKEDNATDKKNTLTTDSQELWAEQIESSASLTRPEGWTVEEWKSVAKEIDQEKIFHTIVESVLKETRQAYDYITDSTLTVDQVKVILNRNMEDPASGKTTANPIKATDISTIKFREKLYFDKEKFTGLSADGKVWQSIENLVDVIVPGFAASRLT